MRRAAGEAFSDVSLIAKHPDLMPELGEELRKMRIITAAREQAAQTDFSGGGNAVYHVSDTGSGSGRLEVRCPSATNPLKLL